MVEMNERAAADTQNPRDGCSARCGAEVWLPPAVTRRFVVLRLGLGGIALDVMGDVAGDIEGDIAADVLGGLLGGLFD
ncbi:hypothetical protein [Actinomadura violacea]|uniref:Uncharacterized protein n=1 Tax=Actinomadura violacea TaxID=2819934 RepID=A0ABS3S8N7_9ACTN|nr:hypothetical protein [Actinomadura violacea]MBO2465362.1 hypothetical protein [Actinomadura violacea]